MSAAPQTHADAETAAMQTGVAAHLLAIKRAIEPVGRTSKAVAAATDVMQVFQQAGAFILACEAAEDALAETVKRMREYVAARMAETGATGIRTESHVFSLNQPAQSVVIVNAALVPADFLTTPLPAPDKVAIGKALRQGEVIAGCELGNGGPPVLTIRARG